MFRVLCNQLRTNLKLILRPLVVWLAALCGLKVVAAEAVLLPPGFQMFSVEMARQVGVDRAVIYQKVKAWQAYNERQGKASHFRAGRWWTYGRPEYWLENEFVWSSLSTVRRAFKDLEKAGWLLIEQTGGDYWLSAVLSEPVKLTGAPANAQLTLFNLESDGSNWRSSIENHQSSTAKAKRTTQRARPGLRKAAVADFQIPEHRDALAERRETPDTQDEGHDMLRDLPGELVTAWADSKIPLETFVAAHGLDDVLKAWAETRTYNNRVGGMRSRLAMTPTPRSAPPPSPADAPTEPDWTADDEATPEVDAANATPEWTLSAPAVPAEAAQAWAAAYDQMRLQFDRSTFETWLREVHLARAEGTCWQFETRTTAQAQMLQHRLHREIKRLLPAGVTAQFEATAVQHG